MGSPLRNAGWNSHVSKSSMALSRKASPVAVSYTHLTDALVLESLKPLAAVNWKFT